MNAAEVHNRGILFRLGLVWQVEAYPRKQGCLMWQVLVSFGSAYAGSMMFNDDMVV